MSETWKCPWCGGEMTGAHPECEEAVREDELGARLRDANAALERERDALREALAFIDNDATTLSEAQQVAATALKGASND